MEGKLKTCSIIPTSYASPSFGGLAKLAVFWDIGERGIGLITNGNPLLDFVSLFNKFIARCQLN